MTIQRHQKEGEDKTKTKVDASTARIFKHF